MIAELEGDPRVRSRLPVVLNDLAEVRGDRLIVTVQPHAALPARAASTVSLRLIPAVRIVCEQARSPIVVADLAAKIAAECAAADAGEIDAMLAQLIAGGVLITGLRPPLACPDGLAHVLLQLHATGAAEFLGQLVAELEDIHAQLGSPAAADGSLRARMRTVADVEHPMAVDLRLGCDVVLPAAVAEEAAAAITALVRLSPHPDGNKGWQTYHGRFLERYGTGALVPLPALVDPAFRARLPRPLHR
ncbi:lantibiotic dehydratase [Nonomuraea sp. 3N208]|uniref:lantibiotic dehydratase n=1 Tax=Nonomuraea sp. 3N208 TaxID=3457421 RepID=UPI003FD4D3F1